MTTDLQKLRETFNLRKIHAVWGNAAPAAAPFGPLVEVRDGAVPRVHDGALIDFGAVIAGNVTIHPHAAVRRGSVISGSLDGNGGHGSSLEPFVVIMDNCTVQDSTFEKWSGMAHGGISRNVGWGAGSFANIKVTLHGEPGARIGVAPGGYLGPGVVVPKGAKIRANHVYMGDPTFLMPTMPLDPVTFEPRQDDEVAFKIGGREITGGNPYMRPIALPLEMIQGGLSPNEVMSVFRLDARPNLAPFADLAITDLGEIGAQQWIENRGAKNRHRPTLGNWLHYYQLAQLTKQLAYLRENAKEHGDLAWHSAAMQSEILHLGRVRRVLRQANPQSTDDLGDLMKAKLYLLGAYEPASLTEHEILASAHRRAPAIIDIARNALQAAPNLTVDIPLRETIGDVLSDELAAGNRAHIAVATERTRLAPYLGHLREAALKRQIPENWRNNISTENDNPAPLVEPPAWAQRVNPRRADITAIGPRVLEFQGRVPVVADSAILLGQTDIGGMVEIGGGGVVVEDASIRSEQDIAPVFIEGKTFISPAATVHTATKEQHPAVIGSTEGPVIISGKAQIHGAVIRGYSYVGEGAVIGDEATIGNTLVAPNSLNPGQTRFQTDGFDFTAGNFGVPVYEQGSNEAFKYPGPHAQFTAWLTASEFGDIHIDSGGPEPETVKAAIADLYRKKYEGASAKLDALVEEHGEIYRYSPRLQSGLGYLRQAKALLTEAGREELAQEFGAYVEGAEYLLGQRSDLSPKAHRFLEKPDAINLQPALAVFQKLAERGSSLSVPGWPQGDSPYGVSFADARTIAEAGIRPASPEDLANFALANHPLIESGPPYDHVITPAKVIERGLRENILFNPRQIGLIARQIERIPGLLNSLKKDVALTVRSGFFPPSRFAAPIH